MVCRQVFIRFLEYAIRILIGLPSGGESPGKPMPLPKIVDFFELSYDFEEKIR